MTFFKFFQKVKFILPKIIKRLNKKDHNFKKKALSFVISFKKDKNLL
jgi:hypothetical protein